MDIIIQPTYTRAEIKIRKKLKNWFIEDYASGLCVYLPADFFNRFKFSAGSENIPLRSIADILRPTVWTIGVQI